MKEKWASHHSSRNSLLLLVLVLFRLHRCNTAGVEAVEKKDELKESSGGGNVVHDAKMMTMVAAAFSDADR